MKNYILFFLLFILNLFTVGSANAERILQLEKFAVAVPNGWTVEQSDEKVIFTMPEAKCEEIYISISTTATQSKLSIEEAWNKMKPLLIRNKNVVSEGEQQFSESRWLELVYTEKLCDMDVKSIVLFTQKQQTKFIVQFMCPKDKFEKMLPILNELKKSFKFTNNWDGSIKTNIMMKQALNQHLMALRVL